MNADRHPGDLLATAIIKIMVPVGVRNTKLEEIHADLVPMTKTGDYSEITVTGGDGRRIPRNDVSRFDDDATRDLMGQIIDRIYTFQAKVEDPAFRKVLDQ